jgi:hypothetical protein
MGDDAELYIESGGDPTTLISDLYWKKYVDDDLVNAHRKQNTMVFIDAESVSADHCPRICGQCRSLGEINEIRYYARQNDPSTSAWKDQAKAYDIKPILMYGEPERNKIDNKIIKDIRRILNTNKSIDIFCIASRDGDFSQIVQEIRGKKKRAVVLAMKNTSEKLKGSASEVRGI